MIGPSKFCFFYTNYPYDASLLKTKLLIYVQYKLCLWKNDNPKFVHIAFELSVFNCRAWHVWPVWQARLSFSGNNCHNLLFNFIQSRLLPLEMSLFGKWITGYPLDWVLYSYIRTKHFWLDTLPMPLIFSTKCFLIFKHWFSNRHIKFDTVLIATGIELSLNVSRLTSF